MMMQRLLISLCFLLSAWPAAAQLRPGAFTTITATDTTATSVCIGCAVGSTTPAVNSGLAAATVTLLNATPAVTTNKIYNVAGALYFNGLSLATGSSIAGTVGTIPKFTGATTLGDGPITVSGATATMTGTLVATVNFSGPGALLTGIPTSAVSTGNYVATVASGTGITSSVTSGNAAATGISLNNTAVTPSTYGSATAHAVFTVDQQGRLTSATTATPQLTITSTYFSSLDGSNLTGVALLTGATFTGNVIISKTTPTLTVTGTSGTTAIFNTSGTVTELQMPVPASGQTTILTNGNSVRTLIVYDTGGVAVGANVDPGATNFRVAGQLLPVLGTVTAPTYSFTGDPDTGVYSAGANDIRIAAGGADMIQFLTGTGIVSTRPVRFSGLTTAGTVADVVCMDSSGNLIKTAASTCVISSARYKHDVVPFSGDALSVIAHIQPVTYYLNDQEQRGHLLGAIAERVNDIQLGAAFPSDFSFINRQGDGQIFSIQYEALTTLAIRGIQQLDTRLRALEAK